MSLTVPLREHVQACFTGIWIRSCEHEDALAEIGALCRQESWRLASWDMARGLVVNGSAGDGNSDPLAAVKALPALASADGAGLMVLVNFHRFIDSPEIMQSVQQAILRGKQDRTFVIVLSPVVKIPAELEKQFVVIDHALPSRQQLEELARSIATEPGDLPDDMGPVLDAAVGLTRYEAEGAFALALIQHNRLEPSTMWELKAQAIRKSGLMELHRGGETFDSLGGLDNLKQFASRLVNTHSEVATARGLLLLGVPGTGKSAFAKALGNETGRPTLCLATERIKTSGYGDSEQRLAKCLALADAMAPCILFIDEIEGLLAGAKRAGDPGVTQSLGKVLSIWLNDHTSDVFVLCTSNDVSELPPEFTRAERFDGVFFIDTPAQEDRDRIWDIHTKAFAIGEQERPNDAGWTGAEIRSCCRMATLLGVSLQEAALYVVPVAVTCETAVSAMRHWAHGKCIDAVSPGLYQMKQPEPRQRRNYERNLNN